MFDIASSEFFIVLLVALVVIGPKDLPKVLRVAGKWMGKARGVMAQFRTGFDDMVRQAEVDEMDKKWADQNEQIMAEHPEARDDGEKGEASAPMMGPAESDAKSVSPAQDKADPKSE